MSKLVVSLDDVVIKEAQLTKDRTTLGRRPYNDIVIDNLAISGEHAVLQMVGSDVYIEDLNSTNGTYINGKAVKKQLLSPNDTVEIGKYKIRFLQASAAEFEKTTVLKRGAPIPAVAEPITEPTTELLPASIKVLNGAAAGREVPLSKVVTTVGKPGVQVASITKRPGGYVFAHVEGARRPTINGITLAADSVPLAHGDVIELAGTEMQFITS
jgi:pSer/pThr/pTyr-binding forkhead associated (FHA) protein